MCKLNWPLWLCVWHMSALIKIIIIVIPGGQSLSVFGASFDVLERSTGISISGF